MPESEATRTTDIDIEALASAMLCDYRGLTALDGGLTYLGQFIAHDLVPPRGKQVTSHDGQFPFALNLNSLYGWEPDYKYELFPEQTGFLDAAGRFKSSEKRPWDLLRTESGKAIIPDSRNDENMIVAQLHRLFQTLHNRLLDDGFADNALRAKELVTRIFHILVVGYFTKSLIDEKVFNALFDKNKTLLDVKPDELPRYFSHAVLRCGHSMVRMFYKLNGTAGEDVNLKDLFKASQDISRAHKIEWSNLFNDGKNGVAHPIDTYIAIDMGKLRVLSPQGEYERVSITLLNLQSGQRVHLGTGYEYVSRFLDDPRHGESLQNLGLCFISDLTGSSIEKVMDITADKLPLWPYLLLEAEKQKQGKLLGIMGSVMLGQVLKQALVNSRYSLLANQSYSFEAAIECIPKNLRKMMGISESNVASTEDKFSMVNIIDFLSRG